MFFREAVMREGLLWFDSDKRRTAEQKLDQAAARYAERFGRPPNLCHVNPAEVFAHTAIKVLADPAVLRGHFWVGRDEEQAAPRRRRKIA
jgi:hypothetical protein